MVTICNTYFVFNVCLCNFLFKLVLEKNILHEKGEKMIHLVVDSTFGIEENYAKEKNIEVVNLKLLLDDVVSEEGFEKDWGEFYNRLENSKEFPKTSQPSPEDFINAIQKILNKDEQAEILILTISQSLSGTINSATIATKNFNNNKIVAFDSKTATAGGRIFVEEVMELIEAGATFDEILKQITIIQEKIQVDFIPQTMEYLKRGGRIGTLSATLASVLKIKPLFRFKNGVVSVTKKAIGLSKAITDMIMQVPKTFKKIYLLYIHKNDNVQLLKQKVCEMLNVEEPKVLAVSPVFGSHVGVGAVGIATL